MTDETETGAPGNPFEPPGSDVPPPPEGENPEKHPKGLFVLSGSELFERLCYYGMRGLLTLYLTKALLMSDEKAFAIYGAYTALVYMAPVAGGKLADSILGYRRAVILGGLLMAVGEFILLGGNEFFLFAGMAMIIIGNGFFKANISTIVGRLYRERDPRRDAGFTIFYMGINLGALLAVAPVIGVAPLGERFGYTIGFGIAGVGMLIAIMIFVLGKAALQGEGEPPDAQRLKRLGPVVYGGCAVAAPLLYLLLAHGRGVLQWILLVVLLAVVANLAFEAFKDGDRVVRDRLVVLVILMVFNVVFWACFEQAGSSLTLFADRYVDRDVFGIFEMSASASQFFNPAFILIFGSVFSVMWVKLAKRNLDPSIPMKFGLGILQLGVGYLLILVGAGIAGDDAKVPLLILALMYMLHTTGELFLSPIGLSMVTKLAPRHMTGAAMGAWFLSFAFANYLAAGLAGLTGEAKGLSGYVDVYGKMGWVAIGCGVLLMALSPVLKKMMHGVK